MRVRGVLCDLDGVVYRGDRACPGAVEGLLEARAAGVVVLFMTNNASRPPQDVADQLTGLGLPTGPQEVLTASQVAAAVLVRRRAQGELNLSPRDVVLAVGGRGVGAALDEADLPWATPGQVRDAALGGQPLPVAAVVQGYGPGVDVPQLTEAVYAVRAGATWIATNDDATLPTERGLALGNGSLVAAVARASDRLPEVVGKPHPPAYRIAVQRLGLPLGECLMIGDRLDTDIAGAAGVGLRSALVLTGVSDCTEADRLPARLRPDHVAATIPDLAHLWRD